MWPLIYIFVFYYENLSGGKYHEQMQIANGATGFSYEKIFGRLLEEPLTEVVVEDPYIRSHHQVSNSCFNISFLIHKLFFLYLPFTVQALVDILVKMILI